MEKKPQNAPLGECSKFRNILANKMSKTLNNHHDYESTYYSTMGDILDKAYASTKIGFECRPFIIWDIRNSFSKFSNKISTLELYKYSSATSKGHQVHKIHTDLEQGKRLHRELTYEDLDTYAKKMAYSSKNSQQSIEGRSKQVNGIWLTNKKAPKEIDNDDIRSIIAQKKFFKDDGEWSHVIWTNDKNLIPKSVKALKKNGIEVRSIYEHKEEIQLFEEIIKLIDSNKFAMASDILRCSITYNGGGAYADLNYKFIQKIDQYCSKFDMFLGDHQNNFYCVKKGHIVMKETLNKIATDFKNHPEYLTNVNYDMPIELTYSPFLVSVLKHSNEGGNIDFYYDYYDAHGIADLGPIGQDNAGSTTHTWVDNIPSL